MSPSPILHQCDGAGLKLARSVGAPLLYIDCASESVRVVPGQMANSSILPLNPGFCPALFPIYLKAPVYESSAVDSLPASIAA